MSPPGFELGSTITATLQIYTDRLSLTAELPEFLYSRTFFISYSCIVLRTLQLPFM